MNEIRHSIRPSHEHATGHPSLTRRRNLGAVSLPAASAVIRTALVTLVLAGGFLGIGPRAPLAAPIMEPPPDITVNADASTCYALFATLPFPTIRPGIDQYLTLSFSRSDGKGDLLDTYDAANSPITIDWTATDGGNSSTSVQQVITVNPYNEVIVDVELSPRLDDPDPSPGSMLHRCITFEFWDCSTSNAPTTVVVQSVAFPVDASPHRASNIPLVVPCGPYACMTARDPLHTLRSTAPDFRIEGRDYRASFVGNRTTGGHWLVNGNLNGDGYIDVLDFCTFVRRFQTQYRVGYGQDPCGDSSVARRVHADISGNGIVFTEDFTYIRVNLRQSDEPKCCDALRGRVPGEPTSPTASISVAELWRRGMGESASGDLNGDEMVDDRDIALFLEGQGLENANFWSALRHERRLSDAGKRGRR